MRARCPFLTWRRETRTHTSSRGQPLLDAHCLIMFNLEAQVPNRNCPHVNFIFSFQGNAYTTHNKLRVSAAMPQITSGVIMQLTLLLSALPAQYLISRWTSGTAAQRHIATQSILDMWDSMRKSYLSTTAWVDWLNTWIPKLPSFGEEEEHYTLEEAFAIEMLMHDNEQGYFGVSKEVRSPRPAYVLHRVGQVIMETQNKMIGVIVGWDAGLRAPPEWTKRKKFSDSELERAKDTPHYRILFMGPDSSSILIGYIPQFNLKLFQGFEPDIPTLERYFSHFDGEKFVMEEWLQEIYPHD